MKLPLSPSPALAKTLAALALLAAIAFIIYSALPAGASGHWTDYDTDDDGLIEIDTIAELQGIRWDHNGDGFINVANPVVPASDLTNYNTAFPNRQTVSTETATTTRMGCPAACIGYELMNNLDFANATTTQRNWTTGYAYAGIFEGNGYTISNLVLNAGNAVGGLFSTLDSGGVIRNLGIVNPTVAGQGSVSGLAAINRGAIIASYVSGGTITSGGNVANVGGLVGLNEGSIIASYATATSTRTTAIPSSGAHRSGGLVGRNSNTAKIIASWSAGNVSHSAGGLGTVQVGGLVGVAQGASSTITHSYCDTTVQATTTPCLGGRIGGATANTVVAAGYTTAQLQTPTAYTGIYANWNVDLSTTTTYPDAFPDNPWRFGTSTTYPRTKNAAELLAPPDDYDQNDNNLIDINNLHQLNAIRHDLNGDGLPNAAANYPAYAGAFPNGAFVTTTPNAARMGCPQTCAGYELAQPLDFDTDGDGQVGGTTTSTDPYTNFRPIGGDYTATFNGNGHTITRLTISAPTDIHIGLFGILAGSSAVIRDVGMIAPSVSGGGENGGVAALVGQINSGAQVIASYASGGGSIRGTAESANVGGLAGLNRGVIRSSYSTVPVSSNQDYASTGGLAGQISRGTITNSYAAGAVSVSGDLNLIQRGGLIGQAAYAQSRINNSYCDAEATGQNACVGNQTLSANVAAATTTTAGLQTPTAYTRIYRLWNTSVDADAFPDNPWNFGATTTYPTLKTPAQRQAVEDYDTDGDNLIEINNLHQLNAIRHDLNGDGLPAAAGNYPAYAGAFPGGDLATTTPAAPRMGCPQTCTGYELAQNLNFDTDGDGQVGVTATSTDPYPNWNAIGGSYAATFDGNGHTISNLTLNFTAATGNAGLFHTLGNGGVLRDVGMLTPNLRSSGTYLGALVAQIDSGAEVRSSYVRGGVLTATGGLIMGGLAGGNSGTIQAAYATAEVTGGAIGNVGAGGLAGASSGVITASYAAGPVSGTGSGGIIGGFVGTLTGAAVAINDGYCDTTLPAATDSCIGTRTPGVPASVTAQGATTAQLQTPTGYTGPYANFNLDLNGDTFPDYPWNFGATTTYPTLYTPSERQTAAAQVVDYDQDNDNLIDITNPHQLNALRYDPDGNGLPDNAANYSAYTGGFPNGNIADTSTPYLGCAETCIGYELMANLDFAADEMAVTTTDAYPNWTPIPSYQSTLDGKGHTITRLTINGNHANAGLFAALATSTVIRDLGIIAPNVTSAAPNANAGALAGNNAGLITASYIDGGSITVTGANPYAGGLAGRNAGAGDLRAVWSDAAVTASTTATSTAGGLIGLHTGDLTASYAAGAVSSVGAAGSAAGGLIGQIDTAGVTIVNSYCDTTATTQSDCIGDRTPSAGAAAVAPGKTTSELQTPTDYTGIYEAWAITLTPNDDTRYNVWNFGEPTQYPTLYSPTDRQITFTDTLPPPLPRTIPPEPEKPYDPAADHPEIYANTEYEMAATCQTHNPDPETGNPRAATVTFDLGTYTGPILLHLSIFTNQRYMAYETQDLAIPTLDRNGQTAKIRVETNPAQTRFRLDGRRNGLPANLLLGYANCQTNDP